jgi:hypothetical protein
LHNPIAGQIWRSSRSYWRLDRFSRCDAESTVRDLVGCDLVVPAAVGEVSTLVGPARGVGTSRLMPRCGRAVLSCARYA